ncbi:MAG: DUF4012 domain-containing protein [Chloroflexi bacterium]|nr:DUF4012 domain-containing protein [Chloroflexota bacterium]
MLLALMAWTGARVANGLEQIRQTTAEVRSIEPQLKEFERGYPADLAFLQGSVSRIVVQLDAARSQLTPLVQLSSLLGWVPRVGSELRNSGDMLALGEGLGRAARDLLAAAEIATAYGSRGSVQLLQGDRFNEDIFYALAGGEGLFGSSLGHLRRANQALEGLQGRDLPQEFAEMVSTAQRMGPGLERLARTGLAASRSWGTFMGYDRPKTYLVVAQNGDELRATGGFIPGAWLLTLDTGNISRLQFWDTVDVDDLDAGPPLPPEGLLQSLWAGVWLFRDSGWYPDFPTSARAMEQMFKLGQGIEVDGVISLNQWAVQGILGAIGPVLLPTGEAMDASSYVEILERTTDAFGRQYIDILLQAILDRLRGQGSDLELMSLLTAVNNGLSSKHILLYLHDASLQELIGANGWDGAVRQWPADYLMVVDSNVGFSKVNRNVAQRIEYLADLRSVSEPEARLDILYTNNSSAALGGTCDLQSSGPGGLTYQQQKNMCYWDYLRVYVPPGSVLQDSSPFAMPQGALYRRIGYNDIEDTRRTYSESGKAVFAGFFNVDVGESRRMAFTYSLPGHVVQGDDGQLTYQLLIQSQPGTRGLPVEVTVSLPVGYRAHAASLSPSYSGPEEVRFALDLASDITIRLELEKE